MLPSPATQPRLRLVKPDGMGAVLVACPDARPPAYQAVVAFARERMLGDFVTAFYYRREGRIAALGRRLAPRRYERVRRVLRRRHDPEIPADRVRPYPVVDAAIALENRLATRLPEARRAVASWRMRRFDQALARRIRRHRPGVALAFSDVGTEFALPACREVGTRIILSVVHGDVREERLVLEREVRRAPDFFPIYLADGPIDWTELTWLHERRLRELELADLVLVPSEHIAGALARHGTPRERVRVVPYAADTRRFAPDPAKRHDAGACTFLFAGGITQRKGIKYLLEAWRRARRPGWRLQLLGGLPADPAPLEPYRDEVEWLGRVGHGEVPAAMARADVFVFPSLFEGSAVVTYEALACGLPAIVTPAAGSVARDGVEGCLVPAGEVEPLARAMERLGSDPALREAMGQAARRRAEEFDWPRYHRALVEVARELIDG